MKKDTVPALLAKFVDGLTKAEGAASHMVHHHMDPRFIPIRDKLYAIKNKAIGIAIKASGIEVHNVRQ